MIYHRTLLDVADNYGALKALVIKVLRSKYNKGSIGSTVVVCVKRYISNKKVKKGEIKTGILIRQASSLIRSNGVVLRFKDNSIVFVDKKNNPIASRIYGPVTHELRQLQYMKLVSMASCCI
jgi:large subunit ribosomal protein L14